MLNLLTTTFSVRTLAALASLLLATTSRADIQLNKLDQCADVSKLYSLAKSRDVLTCRRAVNQIERGLSERLQGYLNARACLIVTPDIPSLSALSCAQSTSEHANTIVCFRPIDVAVIEEYQQNYLTKYASTQSEYFGRASSCEAGRGDTADAPWTASPLEIALIAKYKLGFASIMGPGARAKSSYMHGFAELDPSVSDDSAIEFVAMLVTDGRGADADGTQVFPAGKFVVEVQPIDGANAAIANVANASGIKVKASTAMYLITGENAPRMDEGAKHSLMFDWSDEIAASIGSDGLEEIPESALRRVTGSDKDMWLRKIVAGQPYGRKELIEDRLADLTLYKMPDNAGCQRDADSSMLAVVMGFNAEEGKRSDFGAIELLVIGTGQCARDATKLDRMIANARVALISSLRSR